MKVVWISVAVTAALAVGVGTAQTLPPPSTPESPTAAPPAAPVPTPPETLPDIKPATENKAAPEGDKPTPEGGKDLVFLPPKSDTNRFPLEASWENGLWFETTNKQFRIHVGGNAQVDSTWLIGPHGVFALPNGGQNGAENSSAIFLRRVRLRADGSIYELFDYSVEYDLANANNENDGLQPASFGNITGAPAPCNIWMQVRDVPYFGNIRFGNQVKPIGMSNNTSQAMLPFLERPDNMDAFWGPFDSGFALGVSARDWTESERVTWQYGIYRPAINVFGVALNKGAYGGRVTALPIYEDDGERLVHVGFGTFNGELVQNQLRVRARPLLRNAPGYAVPILVDTGDIAGSRQYTLNPEFAAVLGAWTFQAEWTGQYLTQARPVGGLPQGTVFFHGGYVEALYFLTGEHQEYEKREGAFGRVVPRNNYHIKRGDCFRSCGAWQIGARFGYLDLIDKGINGGQIYDWTLGLNWFLNPNMRVQFNYIAEHRDGPQNVASGWINGFGIRAGYDF
jgi:phosphate-selective porin OprO and OprP